MTNGASSSAAKAETPPQSQANLTIDQAIATAYGHWNAGQADQAEILCQKVLAVWPENGEALHLLGLMALTWNNPDQAIDYVRRACRAPRAPALFFSNLAEMCRRRGLLEEGETAARRATALDPAMAGAWNNLGILLQESGKFEESRGCLERVIALKPDYVEAYNNLGNTLKKLGLLDRAALLYAKALELSPNYPEAHSNYSNLLKDRGEIEQAVAEARRAIDLNPHLADAYINMAAAELARYRYDDALHWLGALLSFAPLHASGLAAQSSVLHKLDRFEEALAAAQQAIAAAPQNGDAHNACGQALQSLGRYEEALGYYRKATTMPCAAVEQGWINQGVLLMEINRGEEAREAFAGALRANPQSTAAYFNAADLKTYRRDDAEIGQMEELLASERIQNYDDRLSLHFALGKAWMDAGDAARAFGHLDRGNKMKRQKIAYNADATGEWLASIKRAFPASLFERFKGGGDASDRPVFIIGVPRSGTSLIEQILAAHPDISGAGELSVMRRLAPPVINQAGQTLGFPESVAALTSEDLARLGRAYLAETDRYAKGRKRVIDKMPANFLYAGLIALILPNARIIHCRRDPVDTCLSCYTKLFTAEQNFTYDLAELGQFYQDYLKLVEHWRALLPPDRFIDVDYEAVVEDLDGEARRLVDFCGLPWDEACLSFHKNNRPVRTASVNQVRQPIYKRSVGRWKQYAPHLGPLLAALNIPPPVDGA